MGGGQYKQAVGTQLRVIALNCIALYRFYCIQLFFVANTYFKKSVFFQRFDSP